MKLECVRGRAKEYRDAESGESYYSCSQLLSVLDPDRFSRVGEQTLELARMRGTDLHKYFFYALAQHGGFIQTIPTHIGVGFEGYIAAIHAFIRKYDPKPLLIEDSSVNRQWGIAGTPDAKCFIQGRITLLDLKTGGHERVHEVQLNLYQTMEGYRDAERMATLYISGDGTFKFERVYKNPLHMAAVQNALQVLRWREMT